MTINMFGSPVQTIGSKWYAWHCPKARRRHHTYQRLLLACAWLQQPLRLHPPALEALLPLCHPPLTLHLPCCHEEVKGMANQICLAGLVAHRVLSG